MIKSNPTTTARSKQVRIEQARPNAYLVVRPQKKSQGKHFDNKNNEKYQIKIYYVLLAIKPKTLLSVETENAYFPNSAWWTASNPYTMSGPFHRPFVSVFEVPSHNSNTRDSKLPKCHKLSLTVLQVNADMFPPPIYGLDTQALK
jgi:hypothetical protein